MKFRLSRPRGKRARISVATAAVAAIGVAVPVSVLSQGTSSAAAARPAASSAASGLGQSAGLLPRTKLTEESALQVNLTAPGIIVRQSKPENYEFPFATLNSFTQCSFATPSEGVFVRWPARLGRRPNI